MKNKILKGMGVALAAAMVFTVVAPAVPTEAAAKQSIYLVTKAKGTDGSTTTYKYNKYGWVSQATSTKTTVTKSNKAVRPTSSTSPTFVNTPGTSTESDDATANTHTSSSTGVNTTTYNVYGTVSTTDKTTSKSVTKKTYYTSGKKKGKLKKETTTTTETNVYTKTASTNDATYNTNNSGGYTVTTKTTDITTYTYNKKGYLKSTHEVFTKPDNGDDEYVSGTYSNLSGTYAAEAAEDVDNVLNNGKSYADDVRVYTTDSTYTTKKGKITKQVSTVTDEYTDFYYGHTTTPKEVTETYSWGPWTHTVYVNTGFDGSVSKSVTKTVSDPTTVKYTYKSGLIKKSVSSDSNGETEECVSTDTDSKGVVRTSTTKKVTPKTKSNTHTTTYKYDKNKNLKSVKYAETGNVSTPIVITNTYSESSVYNNTIDDVTSYSRDELISYGATVDVTTKTSYSASYANTLKNDSNRISSKYVNKTRKLKSGEKNAASTVTKVTYTLKKKSLSEANAKIAEAQQRDLQN